MGIDLTRRCAGGERGAQHFDITKLHPTLGPQHMLSIFRLTPSATSRFPTVIVKNIAFVLFPCLYSIGPFTHRIAGGKSNI